MHSNLYAKILSRDRERRMSRIVSLSVLSLSVISIAAFALWCVKAHAEAMAGYSEAVHLCINSVREVNQVDSLSTLDPHECVDNPYYVK